MVFTHGLALIFSQAVLGSPFMEASKQYQACIDYHTVIFEPAKEGVEITLEAILAACRNERAKVLKQALNLQKRTNPDATILDAEKAMRFAVDQETRASTLVSLMKTRAKGVTVK